MSTEWPRHGWNLSLRFFPNLEYALRVPPEGYSPTRILQLRLQEVQSRWTLPQMCQQPEPQGFYPLWHRFRLQQRRRLSPSQGPDVQSVSSLALRWFSTARPKKSDLSRLLFPRLLINSR